MTRTTMDLVSVAEVRVARTRDDLAFGAGELPLGGGTWLFSEEQPGLNGLVDLMGLGWDPIIETDDTLQVAATCTFAQLASLESREDWSAYPLINQCCESLLGSFKVWNVASVGGNIALALPAGPMTSLAVALDARALVWGPGGADRHVPVVELVTGVQRTSLAHGEVLRSIHIPLDRLRSRTGFRRIALSPLGRTATMVIARLDRSGEFVVTVTGGTEAPKQLRFDEIPSRHSLESAISSITNWYDDPHGKPDWRRAMSVRFAEQLRLELS